MSKRKDYTLVDALLPDHYDSEIARLTGLDKQRIPKRRELLGVPKFKKWDKYKHLLGKVTDKEIADLAGISANGVTVFRNRMGIPSLFSNHRESNLQKQFINSLSDCREQVKTPLGFIDVLSEFIIYELKSPLDICSLHCAIGQLFCYSYFYPNRKLCIVTDEIQVNDTVFDVCRWLNIDIVKFTAEIVPRSGSGPC